MRRLTEIVALHGRAGMERSGRNRDPATATAQAMLMPAASRGRCPEFATDGPHGCRMRRLGQSLMLRAWRLMDFGPDLSLLRRYALVVAESSDAAMALCPGELGSRFRPRRPRALKRLSRPGPWPGRTCREHRLTCERVGFARGGRKQDRRLLARDARASRMWRETAVPWLRQWDRSGPLLPFVHHL
jgi:hypothetical protein